MEYKIPSENQKNIIMKAAKQFNELILILSKFDDTIERTQAMLKLQDAVLWINHLVTISPEKEEVIENP